MMVSVGVPVVDVSPLREVSDAGPADVDAVDAVVAAIGAACAGRGFFVVVGHGLDAELERVFAAATAFFALPADVKERSAMVGNDGYAGVGSARAGGKEMMDIGLDGFDRWPGLAGFREAVERYQAAALLVAAELLRAVAITLEVEPTFFADRMRGPQCFLRLLRYPPGPPTAGDEAVLTGQHTDYGAITLLATDGVPGLEVRAGDGSWGAVVAPPGSLVVNLGDMLARWTNDRYVSTPHRVVSDGTERLSIPFFVNPDPATEVACLPSCVTAERPCRYEPITASAFLQGRIDGTIALDDVRR
jgi:isopenicillin N synthase-like dioxygenase